MRVYTRRRNPGEGQIFAAGKSASTLALLVATVVFAGCGASKSTTASSTPQVSTAPSATSTHGSAAASDGLTGYGATDTAWNGHHQPDTRFAPGTAYDPDPSLARGDLQHDARYYGVVHQGGRVLQYQMRFPPGTTVDQARQAVMASEFPAGTRTLQFQTLGTCAILNVQTASSWASLPTAARASSS
jgi:hypothetical protein